LKRFLKALTDKNLDEVRLKPLKTNLVRAFSRLSKHPLRILTIDLDRILRSPILLPPILLIMSLIMERQHISSYLTDAIHDRAYELAKQQTNEQKILQVYINVIAVLATSNYLEWLHFDTDLDSCESLSPVMATIGDYADLYLPKLGGTIDCRLVDLDAKSVSLTPQAVANRLGCLVLQIDGNLTDIEEIEEVKIIGFASELATEINLSSLQSLEEAIAYLEKLEIAAEKQLDEVESLNSIPEWIAILIDRIIALYPQLESKQQEIFTAIEDTFNPKKIYGFTNDMEQYIYRLLSSGGMQYEFNLKSIGGMPTSDEEFSKQLRLILDDILTEKRNRAD
jgi:Protein of unknown function (DUF1822)